jgi:hypothetical protein
MSTKKLLTYGAIAVAAYLVWTKVLNKPATPAP